MSKILIVEDEEVIRQLITVSLVKSGFEYREAGNAADARRLIEEEMPDLMLLDWMLPGLSGIDFARALKKNPDTRKLPIIMLTARSEERNKVDGLDAGIDDYITKPFSQVELTARIRAVLRRTAPAGIPQTLEIGGLQLDQNTHRVTVGNLELSFTPTEYRLLHFLMTHPERVYSRSQLLDNAWPNDSFVEERTVDVHIRRLRKLLEPSGHDRLVQTVRGAGYRLSTRTR